MKGIVASTAGLAILLEEGIGDTIRVSLTPAPGGEREEEVRVAQQVLQSMGLRSFLPQVSACPGCGRTTSTFFQEMAERIQAYLRDRMPEWQARYPGVEAMTRRGHGLRRERAGRVEARRHRDLAARARSRSRSRRCSSTASSTGRSAATAWSTSSSTLLEAYVDRRYAADGAGGVGALSPASGSRGVRGTGQDPARPSLVRRSTGLRVYTPLNVNGRLGTWVTPTFFFGGEHGRIRRGGRTT